MPLNIGSVRLAPISIIFLMIFVVVHMMKQSRTLSDCYNFSWWRKIYLFIIAYNNKCRLDFSLGRSTGCLAGKLITESTRVRFEENFASAFNESSVAYDDYHEGCHFVTFFHSTRQFVQLSARSHLNNVTISS